MNKPKFLRKSIGVIVTIVFLAGCGAPAVTPTLTHTFTPPPPPPPTYSPPPTSTPPTASTGGSLFRLIKEIQVTPAGNYLNADFVRIGYVPGRDRFIVTFNTMLSQSEGGCGSASFDAALGLYREYAYKEYTADLIETGKAGIVSCHATIDTGGFFLGDDFYLASMEFQNNLAGWYLAKFNAVTWANSVEYFYPLSDSQLQTADPTVAFVNGQIDISGLDVGGRGTHHNFFTTDLQFVNQMSLSDTPHSGFSSMITLGGITYFLSSRPETLETPWAVIVMQYDPDWTYLGVKTLIEHAATPQGLAFDGSRFYVVYTERTDGVPFIENIHLAAFDVDWNLIEDIALTNFTLQDQTSSIHPWLVLRDNRLYVSYSQNAPAGGIETLQAYVKVFEVSQSPTFQPPSPSPIPVQGLGSDFTPCVGPTSGHTGGPGRGRLLWAYSTNGLDFQRPANPNDGIVFDQAGVPDAILLPSGRLLLYFVPGCRNYNGVLDHNDVRIAVAISDRQGEQGSWIFKDVRFTGIPANEGFSPAIVDPNVVLLPDGSLRLFVTMFRPTSETEGNGAYSFLSIDGGLTYSYEGFRYDGILDPENFRLSDTNWQIITGGSTGYAISTDGGNTFQSLGQFDPSDYQAVVHEIAVTDKPGEYRAYVITPTGIKSYTSASAPWTTWTEEPGYRLQVDSTTGLESCELSFPTVVKLGPSNYIMFYLTVFPGCSCGGDSICP